MEEILSFELHISQKTISLWKKNALKHEQSLFAYITQQKLINETTIALACNKFYKLKQHDLPNIKNLKLIDLSKLALFYEQEDKINIYIADTNDHYLIDNTAFNCKKVVYICYHPFTQLIHYHNQINRTQIQKNILSPSSKISIKNIFNEITSDAIHNNVSDIHIEPCDDKTSIKMRIDGLLYTRYQLTPSVSSSLINHIKILANLDITNKKLPQDGRILLRSKFDYIQDSRIATYPVFSGEKCVIRLLKTNGSQKTISDLGMHSNSKNKVIEFINKPQGLILVTGPTGSGKTITLYTLLNYLNTGEKNILTIEDPIEIKLSGINQSQINPALGFNFSNALRAILRQDPDIIMIGEIRDRETADIAMHAAQTGHLVFSTLHTNSATDTINRLTSMGITKDLILQSLSLIIAQRLVRKLCQYCGANNCPHCLNGFSSRIGVFDILEVNKKSIDNLEDIKNSLWKAALLHVKAGITTLDEIKRVIPSDKKIS